MLYSDISQAGIQWKNFGKNEPSLGYSKSNYWLRLKINNANATDEEFLFESVSRFVPNQFIKILDKQDVSYLNLGESRQIGMTILFSDIRGFTTLSESMSADDTFRFVNSYLKRMGPVIQSNRGFIDKFR